MFKSIKLSKSVEDFLVSYFTVLHLFFYAAIICTIVGLNDTYHQVNDANAKNLLIRKCQLNSNVELK